MTLLSPQLEAGVKPLTKLSCQEAAYPLRMGDIYSIRRRNFERILAMPRVAKLKREKHRAALFGVSPSMWSQLKHPDYRIGDELAAKLAGAIGQPPGWMDSEAAVHHADREVNVKVGESQPGYLSQNEEVTPAILARAEFWMRVEERTKGEFPPMRRAQRILEFCRMIQAHDGVDLSQKDALELVGPTKT